MIEYPTSWRLEDLREGMVITTGVPVIDPVTRQSTGERQKFLVRSCGPDGARLTPYHGDRPAETPPER